MAHYLPRLWQVTILLAGKFDSIRNLLLITLTLFHVAGFAATKTSTKNGNWSDATVWSPAGVPAITDAVIIKGGNTVTVNGAYTCADVQLGNAVASNATLRITASGNSLTVTGALSINPNNNNNTYTLDAGPGTINVAGTFPTWSTTGTNSIKVGAGTLNFTPAITIASTKQNITFSAAGTANFYAGLTDNAGKLVTFTGCTANFYDHYTVATTRMNWNGKGTAVFKGSATLSNTASLIFNAVTVDAAATLNMAAGTDSLLIRGALLLSNTSVFNANRDFEMSGNWTNNGCTFNAGSNTVVFSGSAQIVAGTANTTFNTLQVGTAASTTACTFNRSATIASLVFQANTKSRTLTLGAGVTLDVTGNVTLNQPTADNITNSLSVNTGILNLSGNLVFAGTSATTTRRAQVATTSGSFNLAGNVTWMANTTAVTEIISTVNGTLTFSNSLAMGSASGTVRATGAGAINFNGTTAPSLAFGGATAPVFGTASGSVVNIKKGLTATTTALTFVAGSTVQFTGTGTVTPTAAITFGNIVIDSAVTLTAAGNLIVKNNWTNQAGTFVPGTYTVTFNGSGTQAVNRTAGETFYRLTLSTASGTFSVNGNLMVRNTLTMGGQNINLNGYTLTLGNSAGAPLSRSRGIVYGGTFKRWFPVGAITATNGSFYGLFPIGTSTVYKPVAISTSANPTTAGYVLASCNDAATVTPVTYTDNESASIQIIANSRAILSTSGLAGGTYRLNVTYSNLGRNGAVSDLKLLTYTADVMGSYGTTAATTGTVDTPTVKRTGLNLTQLNNTWVVGTTNAVNTPIRQYYFSRQSGNWSDTVNTWSYTQGGASCSCLPSSDGYAVISAGHTVTVDVAAVTDFLEVKAGGIINDNGVSGLTLNNNLVLMGTGRFSNTTAWVITGDLVLSTTTNSTVNASLSVNGLLNVPAGGNLTLSSGTLTLNGDVTVNGAINLSGGTLNLNSNGGSISGTGTIDGTNETVNITNAKSIASGSSIIFGTGTNTVSLAISSGTTVTNNGIVFILGNITGGSSGSTWINGPNSILNVTGSLLTTGTLNTSTGLNKVVYSGGNQSIKVPSGSYYMLEIGGTGTKTQTAAIDIENNLTILRGGTLNTATYAVNGLGALTMEENSELVMQRSATGIYPELQGNFDIAYGTITINQTAGTTILAPATYNNLKLSGTAPCDLSGVTHITGNLTVEGSSSIIANAVMFVDGILIYHSSAASELTNDITTKGVEIISGTFSDGSRSITLADGNWVNNGGTCTLTGTVVFDGTTAQTISGSLPTDFNNLTVSNLAGVTLNLSPATATVINNNLLLDSGVIYTTTQNILKLSDSTTSSSGSALSYVSGPMVKVGNSDFDFPIGKDGRLKRAGVSGIVSETTEITAEYFATGYGDYDNVTDGLSEVSTGEYWDIHRSVTSDSVKITLYWQNAASSTIHSCENLTIAHYKDGAWHQEAAQVDSGSQCSGTGAGSITTTGYVTSFSPFGFGDNGSGDALPVELISFTAEVAGEDVQVKWATALEINNSHFEVERSADGISFEKIGTVEGAGNSTVALSYSLMDEQPVYGISYYRLKQVDYDGAFEYSNIVAVNIAGATATINMYPNPAQGNVNIAVANIEGDVNITIYNQTGVQVYSDKIETSSSRARLAINTQNLLPAGVYFVNVHTHNTDTTQKLIIQ